MMNRSNLNCCLRLSIGSLVAFMFAAMVSYVAMRSEIFQK